jgi:hypothetical protein
MNELSRREVVGSAAVAGIVALAGLAPDGVRAEEKPKSDFDEKAERKHVMACGLTEAEAECWLATALAAGKFFDLPKLHPMDDHEVAHAIHVIQHKLLSRPAYRQYKGLAKEEKKQPTPNR